MNKQYYHCILPIHKRGRGIRKRKLYIDISVYNILYINTCMPARFNPSSTPDVGNSLTYGDHVRIKKQAGRQVLKEEIAFLNFYSCIFPWLLVLKPRNE